MSDVKASRELDAEVAERVMGERWHLSKIRGAWPGIGCGVMAGPNDVIQRNGGPATVHCPYFSTDIAAAWEVVEHFSAECNFGICRQQDGGGWFASLLLDPQGPRPRIAGAHAETAPLAICLAALEAAAHPPKSVRPSTPHGETR